MTEFPPPSTVSEQAQEWLSNTRPALDYPALDDMESWVQLVKATNNTMLSRFTSGPDLPVTCDVIEVAGVPVHALTGPEAPHDGSGPVYLSFHGGALLFGGGELARLMGNGSAMHSGMLTWSPDYRMPPLHPYPAGLDDAVAVYRALLENRGPADVFVGGSSAGGNIAAALVVRARDESLPMPRALVLDTPEVDLTESGDTFHTLAAADNVLSSLLPVNRLYAAGRDLADPYLSPLFADLTGLPPTILLSGTRDLYLSNTVRMHRALRAAGVDAELHVFEARPHGGFAGAPEDIEHGREIRRFLDAHRR